MSSAHHNLDPTVVYSMVGIVDRNRARPGWAHRGKFSGDMAAGLVAALINIVPFLSPPTYHIIIQSGTTKFTIDPRVYTQSNLLLNQYLEYTMVHPDQFKRYSVTPPNYGWWIIDQNMIPGPFYQLYRFKTYDFVNGFIEGAKACGVDFRSYIWGKPFKSTPSGTPRIYDIPGYDIYEVQVQAPAVGAYYTGSYEATDHDRN